MRRPSVTGVTRWGCVMEEGQHISHPGGKPKSFLPCRGNSSTPPSTARSSTSEHEKWLASLCRPMSDCLSALYRMRNASLHRPPRRRRPVFVDDWRQLLVELHAQPFREADVHAVETELIAGDRVAVGALPVVEVVAVSHQPVAGFLVEERHDEDVAVVRLILE